MRQKAPEEVFPGLFFFPALARPYIIIVELYP